MYRNMQLKEGDPKQNRHQEDKQAILIDSFGRIARKLRISVTDRCNMRCMYCMPQDKVQWFNEDEILNYGEITRLVSILTDLGIERIRLTGGADLVDLQPLPFPTMIDFFKLALILSIIYSL
jgi:MoaA/NifB/PqqE/SkfB family radical SAM enzyme